MVYILRKLVAITVRFNYNHNHQSLESGDLRYQIIIIMQCFL